MKKKVRIGNVVLVRYEYSARGDYEDRSELVRVDGRAGDGCLQLSNGDHMFWSRQLRCWFIDDMELVPCSVS